MIIRNVEIDYDKTNPEDVRRFEDAYAAFKASYAAIQAATWDRGSDRLQACCEAAERLLREAFVVDVIEALDINPRSLGAMADAIVEITETLYKEHRADTERYDKLTRKYGNLRA